MNISENNTAWPDAPTVHDLIQSFPLPIALLDDVGRVLVLNERFERTYGPEVLDSAPLQDMIRKAAPGWKTVQVSAADKVKLRSRLRCFEFVTI
jgi:PAS domain-containing protein